MTSYDYLMTMIEVRIAELKARLSEYLRSVRRGRSITVLDRDTPVARLVPYVERDLLRVREPKEPGGSIHDVELPPPLRLDLDVVELLLEERQGER
ncbi:MAG: type II toxin-antitoxin system prevent-host-death family antitoxin [Gemmatimonadota bacterium]|nr:MAG: type II toxin-antitoxin system prevent-host-death family antitoxin [Gemmatimonadota bacterium]